MSSVSLVAISQPTIPDVATAEDFVAYTARVSNPGNQNNNATAAKLVGYLIKNNHWSPFEMVHMTLEINTTRDIGRQILRHRSFSFQEFSQRYAVTTDAAVYREGRLQDTKNRQNSIRHTDDKLLKRWTNIQKVVAKITGHAYNWALKNGIAKEQARSVLPEGMTPTRMYMSGTLRSWIHYCQLRCGNGTQLEHKEIADEVMIIIKQQFPSIYEALNVPGVDYYLNMLEAGSMSVNEVRKALGLNVK